jgi:hypothetical protein
MALVEINWQPNRRELKQFAVAWIVFFCALCIYCIWANRSAAVAIVLAIVATIGLVEFLRPGALRPVFVLATVLALPIGWVVSHLVMMVVYYVVLTPIGLILRLVGYDPLQRKIDRAAKSYWQPRKSNEDPAQYFKQY